jgi:hypothetical protein
VWVQQFCRNSVFYFALLSYTRHCKNVNSLHLLPCKCNSELSSVLLSYACLCHQYRMSLYHVKYPIFVSDFKETVIFSTDSPVPNFTKTPSSESRVYAYGETGGCDETDRRFHYFANAPNKRENRVMRSHNHCCRENATIRSLHIIELYVADNLK